MTRRSLDDLGELKRAVLKGAQELGEANGHDVREHGVRRTLATIALTTCVAVTLAFGQARPDEVKGASKVTLGHGAVVEQPASARVLRGVVVDRAGQRIKFHHATPWSTTKLECKAPLFSRYADDDRDWIVREKSTTSEKLKALEEIIAAEMHRAIRFEKRAVERDTIILPAQ